jgi:hypothetical protein
MPKVNNRPRGENSPYLVTLNMADFLMSEANKILQFCELYICKLHSTAVQTLGLLAA